MLRTNLKMPLEIERVYQQKASTEKRIPMKVFKVGQLQAEDKL